MENHNLNRDLIESVSANLAREKANLIAYIKAIKYIANNALKTRR